MVRRILPTLAALLLAAAPCAFAQVETVAQFNPSLLETPESIAFDRANNKYVSLALTGEIRRIAAAGSQSSSARRRRSPGSDVPWRGPPGAKVGGPGSTALWRA